MVRLNKLCCVAGVVGALVISPDALSEHDSEDADVSSQARKTQTPCPGGPSSTLGPGLQRLVDLAIKDLTTSLKVEDDAVEVVEAQFVTWRDSSAGCPKPGMQYLQVLTNGARIELRVNGTMYHYHSGGSRPPFHCARPSPTKPLPYSHGET